MKNIGLVEDYLLRAEDRIAALNLFYDRKSWANVVRESQEVVELLLKAYLRSLNIEVPRIHDVSAVLVQNSELLRAKMKSQLRKVVEISKSLRRDRELAFYGSEDLTPTDFYSEEDATEAKAGAEFIFKLVKEGVAAPSDR